MENVWN